MTVEQLIEELSRLVNQGSISSLAEVKFYHEPYFYVEKKFDLVVSHANIVYLVIEG